MTVYQKEKQLLTNKDEDNKQGLTNKTNYSEELRIKKAIEADNLCYNYETGFHYIKQ